MQKEIGPRRGLLFCNVENITTKKPDDYVIATGNQYSIKQFINLTAKKLDMKISWKGKGLKEKAFNERGFPIIECDKNYFRPLDVNTLLGDARKARRQLNWKPSYNINSLIDEMIVSEYQNYMKINKKDKIFLAGHNGMVGSSIFKKLRENGYKDVITISKKNLDLLDQGRTFKFINRQKPKVVIIAAARVGGIIANSITKPKFLYENLQIQNNLIHGSYLADVKNLFF